MAARAAASATDGVPTASLTIPLGLGTGIAASTSAGKARSGTPSAAASSTMAGSPALRSTVATHPTESTESPACSSASTASWCSASGSAPLLDPTPSTSDLGRSTISPGPGSTTRSVTITVDEPRRPPFPDSAAMAASVSGRGQPASAGSRVTVGGEPSSQARVTAATSPATVKPGSASRAGSPAPSVAVVTTGSAPSRAATSRARTLAPPRCPPVSATANRPASSTTTTAGSAALSASRGAMARTAMPVAHTRTKPSTSAHRPRTPATSSPCRCS